MTLFYYIEKSTNKITHINKSAIEADHERFYRTHFVRQQNPDVIPELGETLDEYRKRYLSKESQPSGKTGVDVVSEIETALSSSTPDSKKRK